MKTQPFVQSFLYRGFFEAHISVAPLKAQESEIFQDFCQRHHCKAIQIVLSRGTHPVQPMSCSRHEGTLPVVFSEVKRLAEQMQEAGFGVQRLKIEASPYNEDIPQDRAEALRHSSANYFENHWKVLLSDKPSEALLYVCEQYGAHFSKNAFKKREDHQFEHFITLRAYETGLEEIQIICQEFAEELSDLHIPILHSITEYCVYDDFLGLDEDWLELSSACLQCNRPCNGNEKTF